MKIYHYYHIYALGYWMHALMEHIVASRKSGLLDMCETMKVGIVGEENVRTMVYQLLNSQNVNYEIIAEQDHGWEQMTQTQIYNDAQTNDGYALYAHTKGAANPHRQNIEEVNAWRKTMCHYNVEKWNDCVESLKTHDVCGIYWMEMPTQPEHIDHKWFFAGTYWWARMDYIRQLPPPPMKSRYNAEGWIGMSDNEIRVRDFAPGWDEARYNGTRFPPMQASFIY